MLMNPTNGFDGEAPLSGSIEGGPEAEVEGMSVEPELPQGDSGQTTQEAAYDGEPPEARYSTPRDSVFIAEPGSDRANAEEPDHPPHVDWRLNSHNRWIVGDPGSQEEIIPIPSEPWSHPDIVVGGGQTELVAFRATSMRGLLHQQTKLPRQDAYAFELTQDKKWLVGCVADGVSQGHKSHVAADIACEVITLELSGAFNNTPVSAGWQDLTGHVRWDDLTDHASNAIIKAARQVMDGLGAPSPHSDQIDESNSGSISIEDIRAVMATTAICFAVTTSKNEQGMFPFVVTVIAGDSSALLLSDGAWRPLTKVKNQENEVATSAVRPLPGNGPVMTKSGCLRPGEALAVVTDGLGDPLGAGMGAVGRFLSWCWGQPPDLLEFANQVAFFRKSFTDDRTAVVIWGLES